MRRHLALIAILLLAFAGVAAGCGGDDNSTSGSGSSTAQQRNSEQPQPKRFAKTRFLLHSGLAFGAFRRYIYKPYQQGAFKKGAPGRTKALVKAGVAGAFAVDQARRAKKVAEGDPALRKLAAPLTGLSGSFGTLAARLKSGNFNPKDITSANGLVDKLGKQSGGVGAQIKDRFAPIPGL